jgi:hypothetical protein
MLGAIDLHGCDEQRLADPDNISRFVPMLTAAMGMRPSVTLHPDAVFGRLFVDIFSSRPFDPDLAAKIAVEHFGGSPTVTVIRR